MKQNNDIESLYWNAPEDPEPLRNWLLENEFDVDSDALLRELQKKTSSHDAKATDKAFGRFVKTTGLAPVSKWKRLRDIGLRVSAAMLVPVAAAAVIVFFHSRNTRVDWNQVSTSYGETSSLALADGTSVRLGSCTKVIYPDRFLKGERKIFITGEAFLDVARDSDSPFIVKVENFDVVVHGTRFNVRSYAEDREDEVALVEGSVSLRFMDNSLKVEMRPGEMVCYNKTDNSISRKTFSANYYDERLRGDGLFFKNMQLSDIVRVLARRFGKEIIIEDPSIASERYYASFINNEALEEILTTLNMRNHLSIVTDGDVVRINRRK